MDELAISVNFKFGPHEAKGHKLNLKEIFDRMLELNERVASRAAPPTRVFYAARNILSPSFIVGQIPDLIDLLTSVETFRRFAALKSDEALEWQTYYEREKSDGRAEGVRLLAANTVRTLRRFLDKKDAQRREYVVLVRSLILKYIHYLWTAPESCLLPEALNDFFPGSVQGMEKSSRLFFHVDLSEDEKEYFDQVKVECKEWIDLVMAWETKRNETCRDEGLSQEEVEESYGSDFLAAFPPPSEPQESALDVELYMKKVEKIVRQLREWFPPQLPSHPTGHPRSSYYSSAISYSDTIEQEVTYLANLGLTATEDKFHGLYNAILNTWFPASKGYLIDPQVSGNGKPEYVISRHAKDNRNPLLLVELKRPARWTDKGRQQVRNQLRGYIERHFETKFNVIYGVCGIGFRWMAYKMEKSGSNIPTTVLDWQENITSNQSYDAFKTLANLVYHIQ